MAIDSLKSKAHPYHLCHHHYLEHYRHFPHHFSTSLNLQQYPTIQYYQVPPGYLINDFDRSYLSTSSNSPSFHLHTFSCNYIPHVQRICIRADFSSSLFPCSLFWSFAKYPSSAASLVVVCYSLTSFSGFIRGLLMARLAHFNLTSPRFRQLFQNRRIGFMYHLHCVHIAFFQIPNLYSHEITHYWRFPF